MSTATPPDLIGEYLARRGRRGGGVKPEAYARRLAEQAMARSPRPVPNQLRGGGRLPVGPFRGWLIAYAEEHGDNATYGLIAAATGCTHEVAQRKRFRWLHESEHITLDTVDRVTLVAAGPDLLRELYPLDDGLSPESAQRSESGDA